MELTDKQKELFASYRIGSTQYVLAGEKDGCFKLANDFYDLMEQLEETNHILSLHPGDLEESRDKLGCFLCFYMNGPHLYQEKYGNIQLGASTDYKVVKGVYRKNISANKSFTAAFKVPS